VADGSKSLPKIQRVKSIADESVCSEKTMLGASLLNGPFDFLTGGWAIFNILIVTVFEIDNKVLLSGCCCLPTIRIADNAGERSKTVCNIERRLNERDVSCNESVAARFSFVRRTDGTFRPRCKQAAKAFCAASESVFALRNNSEREARSSAFS
jgi:hypothetical protein